MNTQTFYRNISRKIEIGTTCRTQRRQSQPRHNICTWAILLITLSLLPFTATPMYALTTSYTVTSLNDTPGGNSLRQWLVTASNIPPEYTDITINFAPSLAGGTLNLTERLPKITKNITINAPGITIDGSGINGGIIGSESQMLYVDAPDKTVTLRGLHFKNGRSTISGSAIFHSKGTLILESCIFSDNQGINSDAAGGAIFSIDALHVRGCTFYINYTGGNGGAIYNRKVLTLTGNIFYGNAAGQTGQVIYNDDGTVNSYGYNVSDKASGNDRKTGSGYNFVTGDRTETVCPINEATFAPVRSSVKILPSSLSNFPTTDFHGNARIFPGGAVGAVQGTDNVAPVLTQNDLIRRTSDTEAKISFHTDEAGTAYYLARDNEVTPTKEAVRAGTSLGAVPAGIGKVGDKTVALTANTKAIFVVVEDGAGNISAPLKIIQPYLGPVINTNDSGEGSLRYAIDYPPADGIITFDPSMAGKTIYLTSMSLGIDKSLTINAPGVTLDGSGIKDEANGGYFSAIMLVFGSSANRTVTLSGLHFKNGKDVGIGGDGGGAIAHYRGTLNLESCIFSGNRANQTSDIAVGGSGGGVIGGRGGAIFSWLNNSSDSLNVRGCTFYGNNAAAEGGAIYQYAGNLTLTGNIFYGNTAANAGNVTYRGPGLPTATITSYGYNVSDKASGADGASGSGYTFVTGDITATTLPIDADTFAPGAAALIVPSGLADFPTTDFYGNPRTFPNGAAGAVEGADATAPTITNIRAERTAVDKIEFYFTPSADGKYDCDLYPAGSPAPNMDLSRAATGEREHSGGFGLPEAQASDMFDLYLQMQDNLGVKSPLYKVTVQAYTKILSVLPSGAGAAVDGNVVITFREAMNPAAAGTVQLNSLAALTGGTWSNGNTVFTIQYFGLAHSTAYTVHISGFTTAASVEIDANSANTFTTAAAGAKSAIVGTQTGELWAGIAGSATFAITTVNIAEGTYTATLGGAPTGVTAENVTISGNSSILTLTTTAETPYGTYPLTVTIDGTASNNFNLGVLETAVPGIPPAISTTTLAGGTVGAAYSETLIATGNTPITWSLDGGTTLPAGLALSGAGVISGTPTAAGTANFTVKASNGIGPDATKALAIVIADAVQPTYGVSNGTLSNGSVSADKSDYEAGETVTLTITPDAGYELDAISTTPSVTLSGSGNTRTFAMPASNVTVNATFKTTTVTGIDSHEVTALKAYIKDGLLHVSGLTAGKPWAVYNIVGAVVYTAVANSDEADVSLPVRGLYIVKSGSKTVKVVKP